ncbi:unnamed protein product [Ambrosiozyma monospora]|uniref:Unnamed protein product n=1 Tax=Ambrosiozyma monospora TaxID=43982 RepID=A0A9W6WKC2_AMBMO|nr:unnamed protein product [Ambrosiozyma monospora]
MTMGMNQWTLKHMQCHRIHEPNLEVLEVVEQVEEEGSVVAEEEVVHVVVFVIPGLNVTIVVVLVTWRETVPVEIKGCSVTNVVGLVT